jgi:3-hydroxyisobutyrate dehydrogenase
MQTVGFIGLGIMGAPMARNLVKKGYELVLYNRNAEKAAAFAGDARVRIAKTPAEVAQSAETVVTMLADHRAVEGVYFGAQGICAGLEQAGARARIVIDSSTVAPACSVRVAAHLAGAGIAFLDAPVLGSKPQAVEGTLTFLVGGEKETFEKCRELLLAMGKKALYLGATGSGSRAKLANNTLAAITLIGVAESIRMVEEAGIDPRLFLDAVSGGLARSGMMEVKGPAMLERNFVPHFTARLMLKDLTLASELSESLGLNTPLLQASVRQFRAACEQGFAEEDVSAVYKVYEAIRSH